MVVSDARHEMAYQRRLSRHKAQYSLDCDDGIEYSACLHEPTPQELLERMELFIRLWNALNTLPEIQGSRIDANIILGKSIKENNVRQKYNVNIVTVKEAGKNRVLPLPDYVFKADDAVMVLGLNADVDKLVRKL